MYPSVETLRHSVNLRGALLSPCGDEKLAFSLISIPDFIFQNEKSPGRSASRSSNISKVGESSPCSCLLISAFYGFN